MDMSNSQLFVAHGEGPFGNYRIFEVEIVTTRILYYQNIKGYLL